MQNHTHVLRVAGRISINYRRIYIVCFSFEVPQLCGNRKFKMKEKIDQKNLMNKQRIEIHSWKNDSLVPRDGNLLFLFLIVFHSLHSRASTQNRFNSSRRSMTRAHYRQSGPWRLVAKQTTKFFLFQPTIKHPHAHTKSKPTTKRRKNCRMKAIKTDRQGEQSECGGQYERKMKIKIYFVLRLQTTMPLVRYTHILCCVLTIINIEEIHWTAACVWTSSAAFVESQNERKQIETNNKKKLL